MNIRTKALFWIMATANTISVSFILPQLKAFQDSMALMMLAIVVATQAGAGLAVLICLVIFEFYKGAK